MKEMETMEIYERLKTAKSKKKKLDLLRECKETLDTEIINPKLSTKTMELEAFAKIKAKIVTKSERSRRVCSAHTRPRLKMEPFEH